MKINFTKRDLESHDALGLIVRDTAGHFLCFYHKKFSFWTIPLGKAEVDQTPEQAVVSEAREECGIEVLEVVKRYQATRVYLRESVRVVAFFFLYEIVKFEGQIQNREPHKHLQMVFKSIEELRDLPETSDATKLLIACIDEIGLD